MSLEWVLVVLARTTAILGLALIATIPLRHRPAFRLAVTRAGLVSALLVAVATPFTAERPHPVVPVQLPTIRLAEPPLVAAPAGRPFASIARKGPEATVVEDRAGTTAPMAVDDSVADSAGTSTPLDLGRLLIVVYLGGVLGGMTWLVYGAIRLREIDRESSPAPELGPAVRLSAGIRVPFAAGLRKPKIYLPAQWVRIAAPEQVRLVIAHESSHLSSLDLWWNLVTRLIGIVLWPQPLTVCLARKALEAAEEVCDLRVLTGHLSDLRPAYADCLLSLHEAVRGVPAPPVTVGMASRPSLLTRRIERLFDARRSPQVALSRPTRTVILFVGAGLAVGLSAWLARPSSSVDPLGTQGSGTPVEVAIQGVNGQASESAQAWIQWKEGNVMQHRPVPVISGVAQLNVTAAMFQSDVNLLVRGPDRKFAVLRITEGGPRSVRLSPVTHWSGQLVNRQGESVANTVVEVESVRTEAGIWRYEAYDPPIAIRARSDASGRFRLEGLPNPGWFRMRLVDSSLWMLPASAEHAIGLDDEPESPFGTEMEVIPAGTLRGRVTHRGRPESGVLVKASASRGAVWHRSAVTDFDGRYEIQGVEPRRTAVWIDATAPGAPPWVAPVKPDVQVRPDGRPTVVDFDLQEGVVVEGRMVANGQPVPRTEFQMSLGRPETTAAEITVPTDAQGRFRARVAPGMVHAVWQHGWVPVMPFEAVPPLTRITFDAVQPEPEEPAPISKVKEIRFGAGKSFYGPTRLPSGGEIELVQLSESEGNRTVAWRPDGRLIEGGLPQRKDAAYRGLTMAFRAKPVAGRPFLAWAELPPGPAQIMFDELEWMDPESGQISLIAPGSVERADLRIQVASGPWKVVATQRPDQPAGFARILREGSSYQVSYVLPVTLENRATLLRAVTRSGAILAPGAMGSSGSSESRRTRIEFSAPPGVSVDRFELIRSPIHSVTLRDIHLRPAVRR